MATFNGVRFLNSQLNSILRQQLLPAEVVVSDDNSTDKTFEILLEFQRVAPFNVILLKNTRQPGYTQNFANALSHTTGDLIFLSDQDDVWNEAKVKRICEIANRKNKVLAFLNDAELTDSALTPTGLTKLGQIKAAGIDRGSFVMGCCAAVRRELLDYSLPIPDDFKGHDNWIVGISNGLNATLIVEENLQYYRRHGENTSVLLVNSLEPVSFRMLAVNALHKFLKNRGDSELVHLRKRVRLFLERVEVMQGHTIGREKDLAIFGNKLVEELRFIDFRLQIRRGNFHERFTMIISKKNRQHYGRKGVFRKMVRDILS